MADSTAATPGGSGPALSGAAGSASLFGLLGQMWGDLPGLLNDRVELLSLELQRAGNALVQIVVMTLAAAILGLTAWLVLWAALVMALVAAGLAPVWSLAIALLVNLAAAAWAVMRARSLLPLLRLPATRRHLMISPSPTPRAGSTETPPHDRPDTRQPVAP